jgi:hypothetical protein
MGTIPPSLLTSHCCLPLFVTSPSWPPCFLWSPWCLVASSYPLFVVYHEGISKKLGSKYNIKQQNLASKLCRISLSPWNTFHCVVYIWMCVLWCRVYVKQPKQNLTKTNKHFFPHVKVDIVKSALLYWWKNFTQNQKFGSKVNLKGFFNHHKWETKNSKDCQICIFGFQSVSV